MKRLRLGQIRTGHTLWGFRTMYQGVYRILKPSGRYPRGVNTAKWNKDDTGASDNFNTDVENPVEQLRSCTYKYDTHETIYMIANVFQTFFAILLSKLDTYIDINDIVQYQALTFKQTLTMIFCDRMAQGVVLGTTHYARQFTSIDIQ